MSTGAEWWTRGPFTADDDITRKRLRRDAGFVLHAALAGVEPGRIVREAVQQASPDVTGHDVRVLAVGKAAAAMVRGALSVLGPRVTGGVLVEPGPAAYPRTGVIARSLGKRSSAPRVARKNARVIPEDSDDSRVESICAGHPLPDDGSVIGAQRALELVRSCNADEVLLCLLSGGGSALLTLPPAGISVDDVRTTTTLLLRAGAPIGELNTVRKHIDEVKGGRLARAARCPVLVLAISDVIGDDPGVIASGPFSPDASTFADAAGVLHRRGLWAETPVTVRRHLEAGARGEVPDSPRADDECFARIEYRVAASARKLATHAAAAAEDMGYDTILLSGAMRGEARLAGQHLGALACALRPRRPVCIIATGETTVTVQGDGVGGRNQEVALGAALQLRGISHTIVASFATDGVDGPTDAAGALVSGLTLRDPAVADAARAALRNNNAYPLLASLDALIVTGPSGTNVMDMQLLLAAPPPA